jgi:hypothetical protein
MKNHMTAGRASRGGQHGGRREPPPHIPIIGQTLDCYFDYARADPSVRVLICDVLAEPSVVSYTTTGYSEHDPGSTA